MGINPTHRPSRCGLYFGSFNPLHIGHMAIANYMLEFSDLEQLRLVLSPQNPLKEGHDVLPLEERLSRIERSIKLSHLPISVSTVEFTMPKPCYTIYTMRHFAINEPHINFILIIGADNLAAIEKWVQWRELLQEFEVYVYPRIGYDTAALCHVYGTRYIDAPLIDLSSSFIRQGWAEGKNMNGFLSGI